MRCERESRRWSNQVNPALSCREATHREPVDFIKSRSVPVSVCCCCCRRGCAARNAANLYESVRHAPLLRHPRDGTRPSSNTLTHHRCKFKLRHMIALLPLGAPPPRKIRYSHEIHHCFSEILNRSPKHAVLRLLFLSYVK